MQKDQVKNDTRVTRMLVAPAYNAYSTIRKLNKKSEREMPIQEIVGRKSI